MSTSHASYKAPLTAVSKTVRKLFSATHRAIAVVAIIATTTISTTAVAQTDSINIVSTAVPFLRISPDARAGGMVM